MTVIQSSPSPGADVPQSSQDIQVANSSRMSTEYTHETTNFRPIPRLKPSTNIQNSNNMSRVKCVYLGSSQTEAKSAASSTGGTNTKVVFFKPGPTGSSAPKPAILGQHSQKLSILSSGTPEGTGESQFTSRNESPSSSGKHSGTVVFSTKPKSSLYSQLGVRPTTSKTTNTIVKTTPPSLTTSETSAVRCFPKMNALMNDSHISQKPVSSSLSSSASDSISAILAKARYQLSDKSEADMHWLSSNTGSTVDVVLQNANVTQRTKEDYVQLSDVASFQNRTPLKLTPFTVAFSQNPSLNAIPSNHLIRPLETHVPLTTSTRSIPGRPVLMTSPVTNSNEYPMTSIPINDSPIFGMSTSVSSEGSRTGLLRYVMSSSGAGVSGDKLVPKPNNVPGTEHTYRTPGASNLNKNGQIKRPMNAFMVWARRYRSKLATSMPNATNSEISIRLGQVWNEMTNQEKQPFYDEAERIKHKHRNDFPGWVYTPNKNKKRPDDGAHSLLWARYGSNISPGYISSVPNTAIVMSCDRDTDIPIGTGVTRVVSFTSNAQGSVNTNNSTLQTTPGILTNTVNATTLQKLAAKKLTPHPIRPKFEYVSANGRSTVPVKPIFASIENVMPKKPVNETTNQTLDKPNQEEINTSYHGNSRAGVSQNTRLPNKETECEPDLADIDKMFDILMALWPFSFPLPDDPENDVPILSPAFHTISDASEYNREKTAEELLEELEGEDPYDCFCFDKVYDDNDKENPVDITSWEAYLSSNVSASASLERIFNDHPIVECPSDIEINPTPVLETLQRRHFTEVGGRDSDLILIDEPDSVVDLTVGAYEEVGDEEEISTDDPLSSTSSSQPSTSSSTEKSDDLTRDLPDVAHVVSSTEYSIRNNGMRGKKQKSPKKPSGEATLYEKKVTRSQKKVTSKSVCHDSQHSPCSPTKKKKRKSEHTRQQKKQF